MQPYINPYLFQNPSFFNGGNPISQNIPNAYNNVGINGKYVNDFSEVTASDVPMGGQPSVFIKNDRNEIQLREWSPNGQIVSTLYKPYFEPKNDEVSNLSTTVQQPLFDVNTDIIEPIFERISALEDKLDKLSKPTTIRAKKDGE